MFGTFKEAIDRARAIVDTEGFKRILSIYPAVVNFLESFNDEWLRKFVELSREIEELTPFLKAELERRAKTDPQAQNLTLDDLINDLYENDGEPIGEIEEQIIENAKIKRDTLRLPNIKPTNLVMPNNILMNELAGMRKTKPIDAGEYDFYPFPNGKGKQNEITTLVVAAYRPEDEVPSSLTEYERNASDAVCSIWEQAKKEKKLPSFTVDSVYRAMPGAGERASDYHIIAIKQAIEKLSNLDLQIDVTSEMQARGIISEDQEYRIKEKYLMIQEHTFVTENGRILQAWIINKEPLILWYSNIVKQTIRIPAYYSTIKKVKQGKISNEPISTSPQRQCMISYMLRRIAVMKNDTERAKNELRKYNMRRKKDSSLEEKTIRNFKKQSDVILFKSIFETAGCKLENRTQEKRDRDFCFDVLEYWKLKKYIGEYAKKIKGRCITGIVISI